MKCEKTKKMMSLYMDGLLHGRKLARFDEHISACQSCFKELEELKAIRNLCASLPQAELPEGFKEQLHVRLLSEVDSRAKKASLGFGLVKVFSPVAAAALVLLLLVARNGLLGGPFLSREEGSPPPVAYDESVEGEMQDKAEFRTFSAKRGGEEVESNGEYGATVMSAPAGSEEEQLDNQEIQRNRRIVINSDNPSRGAERIKSTVENFNGELLGMSVGSPKSEDSEKTCLVIQIKVPSQKLEEFVAYLKEAFGESAVITTQQDEDTPGCDKSVMLTAIVKSEEDSATESDKGDTPGYEGEQIAGAPPQTMKQGESYIIAIIEILEN